MGSSNSVQINIELDRTNPFYLADEFVSGTVYVQIHQEKIKVDEVLVELNGETGYTTTRTVRNSDGSTRTETDYHTISFLKQRQSLDSPAPGQNELIYQPGQYAWKFAFRLPTHLPPSLNKPTSYPHVRYYVKFVIDKAWYKRDPKQILYLTIFPRVNLLQNPQAMTPSMFANHNRKEVNLKGTIDKLGYLPGEMITGTLQLDNPRQVHIKQIHLCLIQHNRIQCNSRRETICEAILPNLVNTKDQWRTESFSLPIPAWPLAPTSQFYGGAHHAGSVAVDYMLEFTVKASGMFTNFDVPVPILIGTEGQSRAKPYGDDHTRDVHQPYSLPSFGERNADFDYPPPPSYAEATK